MRKEHDRDLPLPELLFDRWERARSLGFGHGTSVYHEAYLYGDVTVAEDVWIGPFDAGRRIGRAGAHRRRLHDRRRRAHLHP